MGMDPNPPTPGRTGVFDLLRRLPSIVGPIPEGFHWPSYLDRHPDLRAAGIGDERSATRHWRRRGHAEGRRYTKLRRPLRVTMNCASVDSLFLRASGSLVCWCDTGKDVILQPFDASTDYAHDVFLGPTYEELRQSIYLGELPYPECNRCLARSCQVEHTSAAVDDRLIEVFQVEPTEACGLRCPNCEAWWPRPTKPPRLDPEVLRKILTDLRDASIRIRMFDFQGHGEPTAHPALWELCRIAKELHPTSWLAVTTNGHAEPTDAVVESGVDHLVCSIDGVDQSSYEPYRVNGKFDRAYNFMHGVSHRARSRSRRLKITWKYIVFPHNRSPDQLRRARELARDAAIDEQIFVVTQTSSSTEVIRPPDLPDVEGAPPVDIEFYGPDFEELRAELALARECFSRDDFAGSRSRLDAVAAVIDRFFPEGECRDPEYLEVRAGWKSLTEKLSGLAAPVG